MEEKATFDIEGCFNFDKRGLVVYGVMLSGRVSREDFYFVQVRKRGSET
jgi:hypothetical protein